MPKQQYHNHEYKPSKVNEGGDSQTNHSPIEAKPLEVKVIDNFDKAFKIFRAMVQKERVLSTYKEKSSYEKPSEKRRRKKAESQQKRFETESKRAKNPERSDKPRVKVLREQKKDTDKLS